MNSVLLFLLGLAVGSFLNVLIYRLPKNLAITGRSFCPRCKRTIAWLDNMPLLSFALRKGKCRYCHSPISWHYPLVELTTGTLFVLTFLSLSHQGNLLSSIYYLFIVSALIVVFFTDLRDGVIADKVIFPAIAIAFLLSTINSQLSTLNYLLSALGASSFLYLLHLVTKGRGMGFGDVKLAFLMGLILGFPHIVAALYIAFLTGAAVSLIMVLIGKKTFGQTIAFGPFLVFATLLILFLYETIRSIFPWLYPH